MKTKRKPFSVDQVHFIIIAIKYWYTHNLKKAFHLDIACVHLMKLIFGNKDFKKCSEFELDPSIDYPIFNRKLILNRLNLSEKTFTYLQVDHICQQIGEWYLLWEFLSPEFFDFGQQKEKLKLIICGEDINDLEDERMTKTA